VHVYQYPVKDHWTFGRERFKNVGSLTWA